MSRMVSPSSCCALRSSITTDSPFRGGRESHGLGVRARNHRSASVSESPLEWVVGRAAESTSPPVPLSTLWRGGTRSDWSGDVRE